MTRARSASVPALLFFASLAWLAAHRSAAAAPPANPPSAVTPAVGPPVVGEQGADGNGYSAAALYNLANSYARAGKPGMAVLNYERAALLAPDDPDIEANLRFVRDSMKLPSEPRTRLDRAVSTLNAVAVAGAGLLGLMLAGIGALMARTSRRRWPRRTALSIGIALMALTVCSGVLRWPALHQAVVLTPATPVRVSPVPMGDPLFVLPEAETVSITAEHEDYVLIKTRAGRTGWVARANIAPVVPSHTG